MTSAVNRLSSVLSGLGFLSRFSASRSLHLGSLSVARRMKLSALIDIESSWIKAQTEYLIDVAIVLVFR